MLRINQLNGFGLGRRPPASFVIDNTGGNNTSLLLLNRPDVSDAAVTAFAISYWLKNTGGGTIVGRCNIAETGGEFCAQFGFATGEAYLLGDGTSGGSVDWGEETGNTFWATDALWHHYAFLYNSANGTADDRVRFYKDNVLFADVNSSFSGGSQPALNEDCFAFYANQSISFQSVTDLQCKTAFCQIIRGVVNIGDLAFDNGGTWTHKPYAGSHGVGGVNLDGRNGVVDAASGYVWDDAANFALMGLDYADLPPYIS